MFHALLPKGRTYKANGVEPDTGVVEDLALQLLGAPAPAAGAGGSKTGAASPSSSPSGATSGSTTTTVTSWSGVADAALAPLVTYATSGAVTEAALQSVFSNLATEVGASGKLTSSQVAQLQYIAKNVSALTSRLPASTAAYLNYVVNEFVNGGAANSWAGGGKTAIAIGSVSTSTTGAYLSDLVGEWFLGTDYPLATVSMSGTASFTVAYAVPANAQLYGSYVNSAGATVMRPLTTDVNQGYLGDCYLLAPLAEIAQQDPTAIQNMITVNYASNGTTVTSYGVRFYYNGVARYVTVNADLAYESSPTSAPSSTAGTLFNDGAAGNASGGYDLWASIVEQAYAEIQKQGLITANSSYNYGNSFSSIGNGGYPEYSLEEVTDATAITDFAATKASGSSAYSTWTENVYNQSLSRTSSTASLSTATVQSALVADLAAGNDLVLTSLTNATSGGMETLISDHAMAIVGFDATTGNFEIYNPWGAWPGQTWDTTFEVGLSTLLSSGDTISADNVGATTVHQNIAAASVATYTGQSGVDFTVSDTVSDVIGAESYLVTAPNITSLTVTGQSGAYALNLGGMSPGATSFITMGADQDTSAAWTLPSGSTTSGSLSLGAGYDTLKLGAGISTVFDTLGGTGTCGVLDIANFTVNDGNTLSVGIGDGGVLNQALMTSGGVTGDWIYDSLDSNQGVFLAGVSSTLSLTSPASGQYLVKV